MRNNQVETMKVYSSIFILIVYIASACNFNGEEINEADLIAKKENKELVKKINTSIFEELTFYRDLIGDRTPAHVTRLDLNQLKLSYQESNKIISDNFDPKNISVLIEELSYNHKYLVDSIVKPLADEQYLIRELSPKIDNYILSSQMSDRGIKANSLFIRNELIYNHVLRICLKYLQEVELKDAIKIPIVKEIQKNGNEDYLEIYIGLYNTSTKSDSKLS